MGTRIARRNNEQLSRASARARTRLITYGAHGGGVRIKKPEPRSHRRNTGNGDQLFSAAGARNTGADRVWSGLVRGRGEKGLAPNRKRTPV